MIALLLIAALPFMEEAASETAGDNNPCAAQIRAANFTDEKTSQSRRR
jgi:hypothetical protein